MRDLRQAPRERAMNQPAYYVLNPKNPMTSSASFVRGLFPVRLFAAPDFRPSARWIVDVKGTGVFSAFAKADPTEFVREHIGIDVFSGPDPAEIGIVVP